MSLTFRWVKGRFFCSIFLYNKNFIGKVFRFLFDYLSIFFLLSGKRFFLWIFPLKNKLILLALKKCLCAFFISKNYPKLFFLFSQHDDGKECWAYTAIVSFFVLWIFKELFCDDSDSEKSEKMKFYEFFRVEMIFLFTSKCEGKCSFMQSFMTLSTFRKCLLREFKAYLHSLARVSHH